MVWNRMGIMQRQTHTNVHIEKKHSNCNSNISGGGSVWANDCCGSIKVARARVCVCHSKVACGEIEKQNTKYSREWRSCPCVRACEC